MGLGVGEVAGPLTEVLERDHRVRHQGAAGAVEIAGDQRQGIEQEADQCAVVAQAGAGAAVGGGGGCGREVAGQRSDHVGGQAGAGGGELRSEGSAEVSQDLGAGGLALDRRRVLQAVGEDHLQHGQQQPGVGVGFDGDVFVGACGFGAARIDHHDPPAAAHDGGQVVFDAGCPHGAAPGHQRVGAEHQQEVGARQVRERQLTVGAVEQVAGDEAAVDVLRSRGVEMPGSDARHEQSRPQRRRVAERRRVADVLPHRGAAVAGEDRRQPLGDVVEGVVPADFLELAVGTAPQRRQHPIGVVLDVGEGDAFRARAALGQRVVGVGSQRHQPLVLDCGDQAAHRFADPAVGNPILHRHRASITR